MLSVQPGAILLSLSPRPSVPLPLQAQARAQLVQFWLGPVLRSVGAIQLTGDTSHWPELKQPFLKIIIIILAFNSFLLQQLF